MPPLYVFDEYAECFTNKNITFVPTYCLVYAEIIPDNTSQLWHQIKTFSEASKFHYRHDHLFRGICLNAYNATKEEVYENSTVAMNKVSLDVFRIKLMLKATNIFFR